MIYHLFLFIFFSLVLSGSFLCTQKTKGCTLTLNSFLGFLSFFFPCQRLVLLWLANLTPRLVFVGFLYYYVNLNLVRM